MESLEHLVRKMESQMDRADSNLDSLSLRLDQFETKILLPETPEGCTSDQENNVANNGDNTDVMKPNGGESSTALVENDDDGLDPKHLTELLVEVQRVRRDYDQVLNDVHQVQELQQEVTRSLRKQMKQVQNHFDRLRERVIGSTGGNNLPIQK